MIDINKIEQETGLAVIPFLSTNSSQECIVYTVESFQDDGIKKTDRISLRIITKNIEKAMEVAAIIKQLLLHYDENSQCVLNGGGTLLDEITHMRHTLLYFYLTEKSEVII